MIKETAEKLMYIADQLDKWADDTLRGGFSTHQVEANRAVATQLREMAAKLYRSGLP